MRSESYTTEPIPRRPVWLQTRERLREMVDGTSLLLCIFAILFFQGGNRPSNSDEAPDEVAVFEQAVESWVRDVTFCCTFELRSGHASSLEAALRGEFDIRRDGPPTLVSTAKGLMSKAGSKVRYKIAYDGGFKRLPAPPALQQPGEVATNVGFDEMTDDRLQVRYSPADKNFGDGIYFTERRPRVRGTHQPGPNSEGYISPISPLGVYGRRWFAVFDPRSMSPQHERLVKSTSSIKELDPNHIEVLVAAELPGVWNKRRRIVLWTKPSPPVIERLDHEVNDFVKEGVLTNRNHAVMSDFVQCPGGMVPRKITFVHENMGGSILLRVWQSSDLGARECTDQDFEIKIEPTTILSGLREPIEFSKPYHVSLNDIALTDLGDEVFRYQEPVKEPTLNNSTSGLFIAANLVLVCLLAILLARRGYNKRKSKGTESSR